MRKLDIEHGIYCYCGRLGQGKTYSMVRDLIRMLNRGVVVYANFTINWDGYDERNNPFSLFLAAIGLKSRFVSYPASNLHYMPTDEDWHDNFARITDAIVAVDEAYVLFDSYQMAKMPMNQRMEILQCRKKDKSIWYTTQRPTAVHVVLRAMTNVFYRCEKWNVPFMTLFARDEFDLGADDTMDTDNRLSRKLYFGDSKFFRMYNTKETVGLSGELASVGKKIEATDTYTIHVLRPWDVWPALAGRRPLQVNFKPSRPYVPLSQVLSSKADDVS